MKSIFKLFLLLFPLISFAAPINVESIKLTSSTLPTRLTITLNQPAVYRVFLLDHPDRLVIDLDRAVLHIAIPHLADETIKSFRKGQFDPDTLRLVLDLRKPVRYNQYFKPKTHEFILDLYPVTAAVIKKEKTKIIKPIVAKKIKKPKPREINVVIDAGHGGKDTGAIGAHGSLEKSVALSIAEHLANRINHEKNMHAVLTRGGDYFVPLRDRLFLARKDKADIFISIHADSYTGAGDARGVSVFALSASGASSEAAHLLADKENSSVLGGVQLTHLYDQSQMLRSVLIDLAQTATINNSVRLGNNVLDALHRVAQLHDIRVEQAPFMVLKSPDIPSVLVEIGFLSNPSEEIQLDNVHYQTRLANAIFAGIYEYIKKSTTTSPT
ncbi:hypothetical protein AYO45_01545 [Gammaproteobacteria bacterium SCGC AG-212-F23]|nr:hypothetical protein AYO45_01545 [Gammaproteobacteria bacterium SCGC AG-212-F23]